MLVKCFFLCMHSDNFSSTICSNVECTYVCVFLFFIKCSEHVKDIIPVPEEVQVSVNYLHSNSECSTCTYVALE